MLSDKEAKVLFRFMEMTISRVNLTRATIHSVQRALIEKGLVTEARLCELLEESLKQPQLQLGAKTLESMVGKINSHEPVVIPEGANKATLERILNMIESNSNSNQNP